MTRPAEKKTSRGSSKRRSKQQVVETAKLAVDGLRETYGDAQCALTHSNPFELLVATILSAQCTDERVNLVTPALFARCPTPREMSRIPLSELEQLIQSTGFFRNKAKNLQACSLALVEQHAGDVPRDLESLVRLPGVGRKTANVVLGTAFGIPTGVVVDTHVQRITRRLGLSSETTPEKIELDLMGLLPKDEWINYSHRMIHHGRKICKARKPLCEPCPLATFCPRIGVDS